MGASELYELKLGDNAFVEVLQKIETKFWFYTEFNTEATNNVFLHKVSPIPHVCPVDITWHHT